MSRYAGAVHRYLFGALHDPHAASDLGQEFALRFLRGDFHRADPARGRFRDFVRRALRNLIIDNHRRSRARPAGDALPEPVAPAEEDRRFDRQFLASWRAELLARAWEALERLEGQAGQPYHTVLRLRVEHPECHSPELAGLLSAALGRSVTAGAVRKALQRSRERFVASLVEDVAASLDAPTPEAVEEELIAVDLLE